MRITHCILVCLCFTQYLVAQLELSGTVSHLVDDNVDNNALQLHDNITNVSLDAGISWGELHTFSVNANGTYEMYRTYSDRTAFISQIAVGYTGPLSENSILSLQMGYTKRNGKGYFTLYDHSLWNAGAEFEHSWNESVTSTFSYTYNKVTFPELTNFNFNEHILALQTSYFATTRTTLIARIQMNMKTYAPCTYTMVVADTVTTTTPGHGPGGQSQTTTYVRTSTQVITEQSARTSQLVGYLRVAQGLTEKTGIALTVQYQATMKKESRYFLSEYGAIPDDELFENSYGYEGPYGACMLTQVLPLNSKMRLSYSIQQRRYTSLFVINSQNNALTEKRNDTRSILGIYLEKELGPLTLIALYEHIQNASNDPFYDFTNNALNIVCTVSF